MISFKQALGITLKHAPSPMKEMIEIENAVGYLLAEDIFSTVDVSPFRNSAMDGFALKAEWIKHASVNNPVTLPITTTIFAGDSKDIKNDTKSATKIMTGAPVPELYDSVVKIEYVTFSKKDVVCVKPVSFGANVRPAGEDITIGEQLFAKGYRLKPFDIGPLASIGLCKVNVFRKPDVLIAVTGDELVKPGNELSHGQIYNSNEYTIRSLVSPFCKKVTCAIPVKDDRKSLEKLLANQHDLIITSGGVSAGDKDLVIPCAEALGWETLFHKVKIKPGKPLYLAKRGKQLLLGLPGNPLSTAITCCIFVIPLLKKLAGRSDFLLQPVKATMDEKLYRTTNRLLIWPARIVSPGKLPVIEFSSKRSSAALTALLKSDGLAIQAAWNRKEGSIPELKFISWTELLD